MKSLWLVVQLLVLSQVNCLCPLVQSLNITEGTVHQNGSIFLHGTEFTSDAWYTVDEGNVTTIYGCPCIGRSCMFKCCGAGQEFRNASCADTGSLEPFSPQIFNEKVASALVAHETFFYVYGRACTASYLVDSADLNEELYIQENGQLLEVASGGLQMHAAKQFCVDMRRDELAQPSRLVAVVCFPETVVNNDDSYYLYLAYAIGLMLSIPFLLATFLVYAMIPELRNLHGMCLMAYCAGLIIAFPLLAYLKLHTGRIGVDMAGCLTVAFIVYYAFQTSFFWLNVMCFDIWRTFSGYRGGGTSKRREMRRFSMYAAYAWGVPLALTSLTVAMQFSDVGKNFITPGFGTMRCWFVDWSSQLVYFYTPVLVLVVCNIIFFSVTAHRIRSIKQETAILKGAESSRSDKLSKDKQRYGLYLKLFIVMGLNWTVELISFAFGGSNWYWIVTDLSIIVLGVFIFFIFVWKKRVRLLVQKRFRSIFGMAPTTADSRATSSAATEDTRVLGEDSAMRLKEMH